MSQACGAQFFAFRFIIIKTYTPVHLVNIAYGTPALIYPVYHSIYQSEVADTYHMRITLPR